MIPYGRQHIDEDDVRAVLETLRSDWLTQGPAVPAFEQAMAAYCGARHAVALSSATAALHLACLAAGLAPGDRLWTSPNTFVASANCGRYCGAEVDFVDIDPLTLNLSAQQLGEKLDRAAKANALPKVLVPVHFAGLPGDMAEIGELAGRYGVTVIEDAAHAVGAVYQGERVGTCRHSAMTVFSFHPVKNMTTGEGGLILTNRDDLYQRLIRLRSHGITRDPLQMTGEADGPWYYEQVELGLNYRLTDFQAALGQSQLHKLDGFLEWRAALAARYQRLLGDLPVVAPVHATDRRSAWHLYVVRVAAAHRRRIFEGLRNAGIGVNVHYQPVHTQPYYRGLGFDWGDFPAAEGYYREALTLPLYPDLDEVSQDYVVEQLARLLGAA